MRRHGSVWCSALHGASWETMNVLSRARPQGNRRYRMVTGVLLASVLSVSKSIPVDTLSVVDGFDVSRHRQTAPLPQPSAVSQEIERLVAKGPPLNGFAVDDWRRVRQWYAASGHMPIWIDSSSGTLRLATAAAVFLRALSAASDQAIRIDAYPVAALVEAVESMRSARVASPAVAARVDVLLTSSLIAYATDLLTGQVAPRSVNRSWHIAPRAADVDSAIVILMRQSQLDAAIEGLRPRDPEYSALVIELARYRQLVASGGWPRVVAPEVLRPGDTTTAGVAGSVLGRLHVEKYARIEALVPITATPGDSAALGIVRGPDAPVMYGSSLAGAVAAFQERHGLVADSVVGPLTLQSMNRSAEFRVRQIAANLERHRWLPRQRGDRFIVVNVPAFRLRAYEGGQEALSMKVVVGAEYNGRTTPVFSDSMSYVIFRPYWNVPQGIASRELWPKQRRDRSYFRRHGYEVARASWGSYVRQKPAPDNALGQVKFIFPNDYAIYLHDTPAQALFTERVRAFSHGCIRVEHPDLLGEFVLRVHGWDLGRVRDAMANGEDDHRVNLDRKLPVYIVYFTTFIRDGMLHFGNDIYDRDDALVRALGSAAVPTVNDARVVEQLRALALRLDAAA